MAHAARPRALRFWFDYVSPNAYLAWTQLPQLVERHGVVIEPVPVLFAGLLEAHGQLGPAEVPAKIRWMWRNVARKAALLGVPLNPPPFHPFNPLLALRTSSLPLADSVRWAWIDALFRAIWVDGLHPSDAAAITRLADECGIDGRALVAGAARDACKARLRRQTDEAIARGVFGVPTIGLDGELFWGLDDFPYLEAVLGGEDPLDPVSRRRWETAFSPSATRRPRR